MSRQPFGTVTIEIPDGWRDGSVLKFAAQGEEPAPSIVVNRATYSGEPLGDLIQGHAENLAQRLPGFEIIEQTDRQLTHRFGHIPRLAQMVRLEVRDEVLFIVTGTARAERFEDVLHDFEAAARSIE
ncbi:MAG: DcrB-related protein [Myxococcota bacterium]